jgi:cytoskeletal protein CcmA (bactofilin family)
MNSNESETIISAGTEIVGTVKVSGSVQYNGKLEGDLHCDGDATIGESAQIKGNVHGGSLSISGNIVGNVIAKDRIEMLATARIQGDIKSKRLTVEDGVTFVGRSEVNPSGQPGSAATPPKATAPSTYAAGSGSSVPPKPSEDFAPEAKRAPSATK